MAFSFLLMSCSKDGEGGTVKPVINLLKPEGGTVLKIGDANGVHFEMDIADNEAIASYKTNIHNDFDDHSYTGASERGTTKPFAFERTYTDKAGQRQVHVHDHDIKISADAIPGSYYLMAYYLDRSSNETHVTCNIVLSTTGGVENEHHHD